MNYIFLKDKISGKKEYKKKRIERELESLVLFETQNKKRAKRISRRRENEGSTKPMNRRLSVVFLRPFFYAPKKLSRLEPSRPLKCISWKFCVKKIWWGEGGNLYVPGGKILLKKVDCYKKKVQCLIKNTNFV